MEARDPVPSPTAAARQVIPLPYAWYVSGELIFELYQSGQPPQVFSIGWEHLKPITKLTEPPADISK
jgi:hypothetical protein